MKWNFFFCFPQNMQHCYSHVRHVRFCKTICCSLLHSGMRHAHSKKLGLPFLLIGVTGHSGKCPLHVAMEVKYKHKWFCLSCHLYQHYNLGPWQNCSSLGLSQLPRKYTPHMNHYGASNAEHSTIAITVCIQVPIYIKLG